MAEAERSALVLTNKHSGGDSSELEPAVARLEDAGFSVTVAAPTASKTCAGGSATAATAR